MTYLKLSVVLVKQLVDLCQTSVCEEATIRAEYGDDLNDYHEAIILLLRKEAIQYKRCVMLRKDDIVIPYSRESGKPSHHPRNMHLSTGSNQETSSEVGVRSLANSC